MNTEPDAPLRTPLWRAPMSASFLAHRRFLLARLTWHERRRVTAVHRG